MKYHTTPTSRFVVLATALVLCLALLPAGMLHAVHPEGAAGGTVVPGLLPQPSVQSSGLSLDVLGIPTGIEAARSPEPAISANRSGPGILVGFGQVVHDQVDLFIKGRDAVTDLVIARRHLSRRDHQHSIFGPAWAFNYEQTIQRNGDGSVAMESFGRRDLFKVVVSNEVWEGGIGRFERLTYTTNAPPASYSGKYTLRLQHGTILEFGADEAASEKPGHLTKIISPNSQNSLVFEYEPAGEPVKNIVARKLLRIIDSFGRTNSFEYTSNFLTKITDFSGRELVYTYDVNGRLESARSPVVTGDPSLTGGRNEFLQGKVFQYGYLGDSAGQMRNALKHIVYPNQAAAGGSGTPRCQWSYYLGETNSTYYGYLKSFTLGSTNGTQSAGGTYKYSYQSTGVNPNLNDKINVAERLITVTDRMGTKTIYKANRLGQVLEEKVITRGLRASGGPASFTRSFQYNDDGQLARYDDEMGSRIEYGYNRRRDLANSGGSYPNAANPRSVEFPLTNVTRIPDARGADQDAIRSRTIYEPVFNRPFQEISPRGYGLAEAGLDPAAPGSELAAREALKARYTTTYTYDYMEAFDSHKGELAAMLGISSAALANLYPQGFAQTGEVNEDTTTAHKAGNLIKVKHPDVTLPAHSNLSGLGVSTTAARLVQYNDFGQVTRIKDAENNVSTHTYFGEADPAGLSSSAAVSAGGGYLKETVRDAVGGSGRNSGNGPATSVSQTTTLEYGAQTLKLDPNDSATVNFPANPRGVPTATVDPRGVKTAYLVNELDQVIRMVRAAESDGRTSSGLTTSDIFGYETVTIYDANNNVIEGCVENEITDSSLGTVVDDLIVNTTVYDLLDQVVQVIRDSERGSSSTGELEVLSRYVYDANQNRLETHAGNPTNTVTDEYAITKYTFDERDIIISTTLGYGETEPEPATFENRIDAAGNIIMKVDGEDADIGTLVGQAATDADQADGAVGGDVTRIEFDGFNRRRKVVDRVGNVTTYRYDSASNVISVNRKDDAGKLLSQIDAVFDERNRAFRADRHLFQYPGMTAGTIIDSDQDPDDGLVSRYTLHDGLDRVVAVIDEENNREVTVYDGLSRAVRRTDALTNIVEWTYDPNGNLLAETETEVVTGNEDTTSEVTGSGFAYDVGKTKGADVAVLNASGPVVVVTNRYTYDALNRQISHTEPIGNQTRQYKYDSRNNRVLEIDALGNQTLVTYDRLNRLIKEETYLSDSGINATRDTKDTTVPIQAGDGVITKQYEYDDLNRVISRTDDNGTRTEYVYDDLNRLRETDFDGPASETSEYNDDGEEVRSTDSNGTVVSRTYDAESRVVAEVSTKASGLEQGGGGQKTWVYDGLNRLVRTTADNDPARPGSLVICEYTYDSLSRLIKETQTIGADTLSVITEWDGPNRKVGITYPDGRKIRRTYDTLDRLDTIHENATGAMIASFSYEGSERGYAKSYGNGATQTVLYDANRRATTNEWRNGSKLITSFETTYNKTNRRVSENRQHLDTGSTDANVNTYKFDSAYRLVAANADGAGITTTSSDPGTLSTRTLSGTDTMLELTEEGANPATTVFGSNNLNQYTTVGGVTRRYDLNGNLDDENTNDTTDATNLEFIQDYENRLVEIQDGTDSLKAAYAYDAKGRRVMKTTVETVGATTVTNVTRYVYSDWQVVEERVSRNGGQFTLSCQYVDGRSIDEHIQMRKYGAGRYADFYYHCNDQGFVSALTDEKASVIEFYKYDWLGRVTVLKAY